MADSKTMGETVRNTEAHQRQIERLLADLVLSSLRRVDSGRIRELCTQGKLLTLEPGTSVRTHLLGDFLVLEGMLTRSSERNAMGDVDVCCTGDLILDDDSRFTFLQPATTSYLLCLPPSLAHECKQLQREEVRAVGSGPLRIVDLG